MNALIQKEIRLVLPAFVAAFVMIEAVVGLHVLTQEAQNSGPLLFVFGLAVAVLGLSSFGREFSLSSFTFQMAQPVQRRRLWRTKLAVLSACLLALLCIGWVSVKIWVLPRPQGDSLAFSMLASLVLATGTGALWSTLLLRQVIAAFWFALLLPWAVLLGSSAAGFSEAGGAVALLAYAIGGFFFAARLFKKAQDANWTGGEIAMPFVRSMRVGQRSHRPWRALIVKEMQFQQITLLGIGALFILHIIAVLLRKEADAKAGMLTALLDFIPFVWIFVPLLAGGMSVAEERRMGTLDTYQTLPVSRTKRLLIKALAVLTIGGLLSSILLVTAESIAKAIGATPDVGFIFSRDVAGVLACVLFALSIVAFYASTASRSVLQALGISIPMAIFVLVFFTAAPQAGQSLGWWGNCIFHAVVGPAFFFAIVWLIRSNFAQTSVGWALWRRQLVVLSAALGIACASAAAIYNRVWELVLPLEPAHGPAKLSLAGPNPVRFSSSSLTPGVLTSITKNALRVDVLAPDSGSDRVSSRVLEGAWLDAEAASRELLAIRLDGTLWISRDQVKWEFPLKEQEILRLSTLIQLGTDSNWTQIIKVWGDKVLLSKRDGSLWRLGPQKTPPRGARKPLQTYEPVQLKGGPWHRIVHSDHFTYVWNRSGEAYLLRHRGDGEDTLLGNGELLHADRIPTLDHAQIKAVAEVGGEDMLGIMQDGSLRVWRIYGGGKGRFRINPDRDWVSISGNWWTLVGLKSDGSIWQLQFKDGGEQTDATPVQLSSHRDWLGISTIVYDNAAAIAADGSIWVWTLSTDYRPHNTWLAPSRKPVLVSNILDPP